MEEIINSFQSGDERPKELEELLGYIQIQYSCLESVDKALEMVTDASITMACNLQLARCDTTLKQCAPQLFEHDRNRLRKSGFMTGDLFSPEILNAVEKKLEKERSPKRKKNCILCRFFSQRSLSTVPTPILMDLPTLKVQESLLFVTLRVNNSSNRNLPSPREEVVGADESDYQSCVAPGGHLLSFFQVW